MDARTEFIKHAIWHGDLRRAEEILAAHPELNSADLHIAAILGDDVAVKRFLAANPKSVNEKSAPFDGDALNYLGLSKYLRLKPERSDAFVRAATALLDAGADVNTGFWWNGERETAFYGVAGVAHHGPMTKLFIDRGADVNDGEVCYHSPETSDLDALQAIVETGRVTPENLCLMLIRKLDWHDEPGVRYLLEHGANPQAHRSRGWAPRHHSLERCNDTVIVGMLLECGADPMDVEDGITGVQRAIREGRSDILTVLERRGVSLQVQGFDELLMALNRGDDAGVKRISAAHPEYVESIKSRGGEFLSKWCGAWNWDGMRRLLELGVSANTVWPQGDGYFSIPKNALPIHVASWYISPKAIRLLLDHGAEANARAEHNGATPLDLYVLGCTESYWSEGRVLEGAEMIIDAGGRLNIVTLPSGDPDLDLLITTRGATA
jgi:ankyrin repeat protein